MAIKKKTNRSKEEILEDVQGQPKPKRTRKRLNPDGQFDGQKSPDEPVDKNAEYDFQGELTDDEDENIDAAILDEAKKNIYAWYTFFAMNYEKAENDKQFTLLTQWNTQEQEEIVRLNLPTLQFNKLYDFTKKIIGEARNITPSLQVRSKKYVSSKNDDENLQLQNSINIIENLIRATAYDSQAQLAYQTAFANAIYCGYGAIHIKYDYEDSMTFNRVAKVEGVTVAERAFFDPTATTPCKTDGDYAGIYYDVDRRTFKHMYPNIQYPSSFPEDVPRYFTWDTEQTITIVDYYKKEWFKRKLVLLANGEALTEEDYNRYSLEMELLGQPMPEIVDERDSDDYEIWHYKMINGHVLESSKHPSKILPVIFVDGDSFMFRGLQYTQSFVRHAIDAQRFLNYTGIAIAQGLKNTRKEQFIGTPTNIKGYEKYWQRPELYQGILLANPDPKTGMPTKLPPSEIPSSLYQNYERAEMDIQSILGLYNANLGAPTAETSGIAINAKKQQGQFAAAVYRDNLIRAQEEVARAFLSMIPVIYDTERTVTLIQADGTSSAVQINQRMPDGSIKNDITGNYYDIVIEAGANYADQKQAALELLVNLVKANPSVFPLVADLIADNMDIENRPQLVERLRTLVPPAILAKEKGEKAPPPAPTPPNPQVIESQNKVKIAALNNQIANRKLDLQQSQLILDGRDQNIDILKTAADDHAQDYMAQQKHLEALAEMYRAGVDSDGNNKQLLSKLLDIHAGTAHPKQ